MSPRSLPTDVFLVVLSLSAFPETKQGVFQRIKKWFTELKVELKKVGWPTKSQTINNTLVALAVIVAASIVIWGFDELATMGVKAIIALV